ncbi:MAG: methylated-DNA--[protein]-cysteine S-methyltransferase [Bacteroidota bacterium]
MLIQASEEQILNYFENKIQTFDVPIQYTGSEFEKRVWAETLKIPFGQTNSYECIAKKIQMPTAVRAVGQAIRKNPIVIIIPCHRIIGKSGKLVGYVGGLDKKRALLDREKKRDFDLFSRSHEFSYHSHL